MEAGFKRLTREPQIEETPHIKQNLESGRPSNLDGVAAKLETKSEAPSGARNVAVSELDETSSIPSYNDSMFDDIDSVLSSVSSLGNDAQAMFVGAFVDLLLRDPSVNMMIARATSDTGIGVERFRRAFNKILKNYSRDLRDTIQQKEQKQQRVVMFVFRKTTLGHASFEPPRYALQGTCTKVRQQRFRKGWTVSRRS